MRGHQDRAEDVEAGAGALPGQRPPHEGDDRDTQDRQRHHRAPAERVLHQPAGERAQAAHRPRRTRPGGRARGRAPPRRTARCRTATPSVGTAAAPAPWKRRATTQDAEGGGQCRDERARGHQPDAHEERDPDADQVGDPAVDRGRDREHQRVEADRPGRLPDADAEVLPHQRQRDRGRRRAHAGEAEEESEKDRDATRVVVGALRGHGSPTPTGPPPFRPRVADMTTDDLVHQARQQALGDLPRRTARRMPDKIAVVDGDTRLTFAELDAAVDRAAARTRRRRARQGRPAGAAVPQLLAVRGAELRGRPGRCRAGAGELHARRRRDRVHPRPQRRPAFVVEDALVPMARAGAGRVRRRGDGPRGRPARGRRGPRGVGGRAGVVRPRGRTAGGRGGRRRPGADDVHLRHRVAAQGCAAVEPVAAVAVRLLRDRRRHERRRRRAAHAAALPLRPAGLLPRHRRLPRRHQHHPARARPGRGAARDRAASG